MEEIESTAKQPATSVKHGLDSSIHPKNTTGNTTHTPHAKPKKHLPRIRSLRKETLLKTLVVSIGLFGIGVAIYLFIMWKQTIPPPLPQDIVSSLYFQGYYPSHIPHGYHFKNGSIANNNGLFFYKFSNGNKIITVTEQAAPSKNIDLNKLEGYTSLTVAVGKAVTGQSVGNPSVIILTDSTLINITSSKGVTRDQVLSVAKNMKPVQNP